jgi:hypothetical protein
MNAITLTITGVGNVKSLKNNKLLVCHQKRMITNPKAWKQQKAIVDQLESQLYLALGIDENMTLMEQREQCSTVSYERVEEFLTCLPNDDTYLKIPHLVVKGVKVEKGEEFSEVTIEVL